MNPKEDRDARRYGRDVSDIIRLLVNTLAKEDVEPSCAVAALATLCGRMAATVGMGWHGGKGLKRIVKIGYLEGVAIKKK